MLRTSLLSAIFGIALLHTNWTVAQENWTRFHGPNGSGLAEQASLPTTLSKETLKWEVELAGSGSSSPVIYQNKLFVTSCDSNTAELMLQCFDSSSGKELWSKSFESTRYRMHRRNSFASSTPAVDESHVYITFANPDSTMLVALDHQGKEIWRRDFGTWISQHGYSASPMVHDGKVVLFNSQQAQKLRPGAKPGKSRMIAVDAKDGSDVWETFLTATRACYAVPSVYRDDAGKEQLISCNTGDGFFGLDASTGKRLWSTQPFRMRTVASTLIAGDLIIGSCGSGGGGNYLVAVRLGEDAGAQPEKAYEITNANYVPSPVALNGKLFLFTDKGIGRCFDLQTGKLQWQKRIGAGFSGSPIATKNHLYVMDEDGTLYVIAAKADYELVSKYPLGEPTRATPAVANDRIYFRTETKLICAGNSE